MYRRPLAVKRKAPPNHRVLRCLMMGHQVSICRRLCTPIAGRGLCGRPALHGLRSYYQEAIAGCRERVNE